MRSLLILLMAFLPACTIVVVPADRPDCPDGTYTISGSSYSTPHGGWGQASINWQNEPPPVHLEWGPFKRRNLYDTPRLVYDQQEGPFQRRRCR